MKTWLVIPLITFTIINRVCQQGSLHVFLSLYSLASRLFRLTLPDLPFPLASSPSSTCCVSARPECLGPLLQSFIPIPTSSHSNSKWKNKICFKNDTSLSLFTLTTFLSLPSGKMPALTSLLLSWLQIKNTHFREVIIYSRKD